MLDEATTIRAKKSSTVATGVSYTSDLRWALKKKLKGLRSGESGGQAIGLTPPVSLPGNVARIRFHTAIEKSAGASSCMNHMNHTF
ncbi:hypothetical protein TNCV_1658941 [Trichonephila clavipes]|nr:hypothetical protein TNCV_1658941 [Trichonephila clavipes]